jgi:hypothetical protein
MILTWTKEDEWNTIKKEVRKVQIKECIMRKE